MKVNTAHHDRALHLYFAVIAVLAATRVLFSLLDVLWPILCSVLIPSMNFHNETPVNMSHDYWKQFLGLGMILSVPSHLYITLLAIFLLSNRQRRIRMGMMGVLHVLANLVAVISSYFLMVPVVLQWNDAYNVDTVPLSTVTIHGASSLIGAATSLGLLWMIPAVSKKHQRLFSCASVSCLTLSLAQVRASVTIYSEQQEAEQEFLHSVDTAFRALSLAVTIPGFVLCVLNLLDVWSSLALKLSDRRFRSASLSVETSSACRQRRSSAYTYSTAQRTFFRAFRKSPVCLYLFPLTEKNLRNYKRTVSMMGVSPNASIEPSVGWATYAVGETTLVMVFMLRDLLGIDDIPMERIAALANYQFCIGYNFYAVVTFGLTLVLKGKLTPRAAQIGLAHSLLATSFFLHSAPDLDDFLACSFVLVFFVALPAGLMTLLVSEPIHNDISKAKKAGA